MFIDEAQRIPNIGLTLKLFTDQIKDVQIASGIEPQEGISTLYHKIIQDVYRSTISGAQDSRKQLSEQIMEQNAKLTKARDKYLADELEQAEYKIVKIECEKQMNILEAKLRESSSKRVTSGSMDKMLNKAISVLSNLTTLYNDGILQSGGKLSVRSFLKNLF